MNPERRILSNGMVVVAVANPVSPAVHLRCLLAAGAAFDGERPGLACLAARLLDGGTEHRSRPEIYEELDSIGATLEIGTTRETVSLDLHCLTEDFSRVADVLRDILESPTFPGEELERQRAALVTSNLAEAQDTEAVCENRLQAEIFPPGHPYHYPLKGSVSSVGAITRDEVVTFHRRFHTPEGAILACSGDLEAGDALALLEKTMTFPGGESRPATTFSLPEPLGAPVRVELTLADKTQTDIGFGHRGLKRNDPDYYAFLIVNHALGGTGMGGRLGMEIREKRGLAYYAYSSFSAGVGAGAFMVRAGVSPAGVDAAVECIFEELNRAVAQGITEREIEEAKRYLIGSLPRELETHAGVARHLGEVERFRLGADYLDRFAELVGQVSASDCRRVAGTRLEPDRGVLVIVGPPSVAPGSALPEHLARSV